MKTRKEGDAHDCLREKLRKYKYFRPSWDGLNTRKTTTAITGIRKAADQFGPEGVFVTSFTRAAAKELTGRELDGVRAGTLHSHCFHVLDKPQIAERVINSVPKGWTLEEVDEGSGELVERDMTPWNHAYPHWSLSSGKGVDVDDPFSEPGSDEGDPLMAEMQRLRAAMIPRKLWVNAEVGYFADAWTDWKQQHGLIDFTEMLELALKEIPYAPGNPAIGFVDEAQDTTPLAMALIRQWATFMSHLVILGDDDQILYAWAGCRPDTMFNPPPDHLNILKQSWRVPRKVHMLANRWIQKVAVRQPKEYLPRDADGEAKRSPATWREPQALIRDAQERMANGQSVMFLATCGYMLQPLLDELREAGIPFHNPYRDKQANWNPFHTSSGTTTTDKLLMYLRNNEDVYGDDMRLWTYRELATWIEPVQAKGVLLHGAKTAIKELKSEPGVVSWDKLQEWFTEDALNALYDCDPEWYSAHTLERVSKSLAYPMRVLRKMGPVGLQGKPQCIVGTIHCSPADEPVLTTDGWVEIGDIDPEQHRLAGYHRGTNSLTWGGGRGRHRHPKIGFAFEKSVRPYSGSLVVVETEQSRTRVTPNHRVIARFAESFMHKHVVYLMRRGDWWRVGICTSAHRPYKSGGVGGRLVTEQADEGWVLGVYETREDAIMAEAVVQAKYGIPGLTFEAAKSRALTSAQLHTVHEAIKPFIGQRVDLLMTDYGMSREWPLYTRSMLNGDIRKRNMRGAFVTEAANLLALSGYVEMLVPTDEFAQAQRGSSWKPQHLIATVAVEHFEGDVYGLDVPPHHYYISGNAVVHNSVKGGEADCVYVFPDLSGAAYFDNWMGNDQDSIIRLFYVAMTRARESIVICSPASYMAVEGIT